MLLLKVWTAAAMLNIAQPGTAGTTRVAVVNIGAVSERYQKTTDLEATFEQRRIAFNQRLADLRQKIDTAKRSLQEELKPGTPEFEGRRKEMAMTQAELQWFTDSEGQKIEEGLAGSLRDIYADIQGVVEAVAKEQNIDVVLAVDRLPADPPTNTQQARQQIVLQKVLYWHPRTDVTEEVVTRLNAKYQASKPAGAGGADPPFAEDGWSHYSSPPAPDSPTP